MLDGGETIRDHMASPRNRGAPPDGFASARVENPVCGDLLALGVRIEGGLVAEVRWDARGCGATIACASALSELAAGRAADEAARLAEADVERALGGLPPLMRHGAQLAVEALREAIAEHDERERERGRPT